MNNTIYIDSKMADDQRRDALYAGQLFVYSPRQTSLVLTEFAREIICEGFHNSDPTLAQFDMPVEEFVKIFAALKPIFIHHPKTKQLVREMLLEFGCDMESTYLDVPRLRGVTSDGYLASGVGYAHHPHRDTWYSAPLCQINWWLPIYPFASESSMAFHPKYWNQGVPNGSPDFNYYEWNSTSRANAAQHIKSDTRPQPKSLEPIELDPQIRLIPEAGGSILFSAAQMHSTVANTSGRTRFSIDFRTVHLHDLRAERAAPNIDSRPVGTSLRDFMRGTDLSPLPEEVISMYDNATVKEGLLVFRPVVRETAVVANNRVEKKY
jgi:hypothetical protein